MFTWAFVTFALALTKNSIGQAFSTSCQVICPQLNTSKKQITQLSEHPPFNHPSLYV